MTVNQTVIYLTDLRIVLLKLFHFLKCM